jgi:glc operon protein GlcG
MNQAKRFFRIAVCTCGVAAAMVFLAAGASAQGTLDKFVVSGPAAKAEQSRTVISEDTAKQLIQACEDYAKQSKFASSIVILDPSGSIVMALRMDGQQQFQFDGATYKAQTALYTRLSTGQALMNRYPNQEERLMRTTKQGLFFRPGGFPIIVDDQLIGAIGVSGGRADEMEAYQALEKVIGPQPPIPQAAPSGAGAPGAGGAPQGQPPRQ